MKRLKSWRRPMRREIVEIIGDEVVILVPVESLPNAASIAWDRRSTRKIVVTDIWAFVAELVRELRREDENGDTLVTDMLDASVTKAIENGDLGFEFEDELAAPAEKETEG